MRSQPWTLAVVFLIVLAHSEAARLHTGEVLSRMRVAGKIVNRVLKLDEEVLKLGGGRVQNILDWMPPMTKVSVSIPNFHVEEHLSITKPVHITSEDKLMSITCDGMYIGTKGFELVGAKIEGCTRSSPFGVIRIHEAQDVLLKDIHCSGSSNSDGPVCISTRISSLTLENFEGKDNESGVSGGVFSGFNSNITMESCTFEGNKAPRGGAIHMTHGKLTVSRSNFIGNVASIEGGAIDCSGEAELLDSRFIGNTGQESGGAARFRSLAVTVANCVFEGNKATLYGGALASYARTDVSHSTFIGNKGIDGRVPSGGGAYLSGMRVRVAFSHFEGNAGAYGGGLYASQDVSEILDCKFIDNSAGNFGGGAYSKNSDYNGGLVTRNLFKNNTSNSIGGGLYARGPHAISASSFLGNNANGGGGGAYVRSYHVTVATSNFEDNTTGKSGGGMNMNGRRLTVSSTTFSKNTASSYGGGVYSYSPQRGGSVDLKNSRFLQNTAGEHGGGGVYSRGEAIRLNGNIFNGNSAKNSAGGGVRINCARMTALANMFKFNTADVEGGAAFVKGKHLFLQGSIFIENTAPRGGGVATSEWTRTSNLDNIFIDSTVDIPFPV